jgi:hypothetical protein
MSFIESFVLAGDHAGREAANRIYLPPNSLSLNFGAVNAKATPKSGGHDRVLAENLILPDLHDTNTQIVDSMRKILTWS